MTRPDLPDGKNWRGIGREGGRKESVPYDECPHCGRYKIRFVYLMGGILTSDMLEYKCKNCKYSKDVDSVGVV